jgi:hypothetical protein
MKRLVQLGVGVLCGDLSGVGFWETMRESKAL